MPNLKSGPLFTQANKINPNYTIEKFAEQVFSGFFGQNEYPKIYLVLANAEQENRLSD